MNKFQKLACKCARDNIKLFKFISFKKARNEELKMMKKRNMNLKEVYEYKKWFKKYL